MPRPTLYLPAAQFQSGASLVVVRTSAPLDALSRAARDAVRALDPDVQVVRVVPFAEMLDGPLARPRFTAMVIGIFGVAALMLAAIGLYGVMATLVRQRHRELGVRLAVGATAADVRRLVLGEGLRLAAVGVAAGLVLAMLAMRTLRSVLFGVRSTRLDEPGPDGRRHRQPRYAGVVLAGSPRRTHDPVSLLRSE